MTKLHTVFEVLGMLGTASTLLATVFPVGSKWGYWFAKFGADIKNHTSPTTLD